MRRPGAQGSCELTVRRSSPGRRAPDTTTGFHALLWIAAQRRGVRRRLVCRPGGPAPGSHQFTQGLIGRADRTSTPHDMEVHTLPNALVTGSPERVPDIAIALKSAGFDILSAGAISPQDVPDLEENSVDCYVQLPIDPPQPGGGA